YTSDKKLVGFHLFAQRVNKQTLLSEGEVKEIAFADVDGEAMMKNMIDPVAFVFPHRISLDNSTIAILTYELVGAASYGTYSEVRMLDNNFKELWKNKFNIDKVGYAGMTVFDKEQVLIVWRDMVPVQGKNPFSVQTISESKASGTMNFDFGDHQMETMASLIDKNKRISICGFYYDNDANTTRGFYMMSLNSAALEITDKIFTPLDLPVTTKKGQTISEGLENVKILDNGDILFVTQQIIRSSTIPEQGVGSSSIYTCLDITAVRLNSKGNVLWKSSVPVKQVAYNEYAQYSYSVSLIKGDKIYVLFNDDEKNAGITNGGTPKEYNTKDDGKLFMLTIDGSGNIVREIFSSKIGDMELDTSHSFAMDENTLLLYTETKREYQIDKVVFH
ncbi:MAG TPA: hypothetical protein VFJ43_10320, partial [Bacteroidia bacterium]|nr:hypothetical protein [Bacteroidia bacterium]